MVAASFTGLVLAVIGHSAAATKINLFFAINTLFSLGVLRVVGWAHDAWASTGMLWPGPARRRRIGIFAARGRKGARHAAVARSNVSLAPQSALGSDRRLSGREESHSPDELFLDPGTASTRSPSDPTSENPITDRRQSDRP
jgi:hypothetical protein